MTVKASSSSLTLSRVDDGTDGSKGDQGISVVSTVRYYVLATSKPSEPSTSWSTTEPNYTSSKMLYFADLTTFDDGTTKWSDISLSSSYVAADKATTSAIAAETSASAAKTSAANAASDASTARTNASNAATSAKTAESKATAAATSASNAESSAASAKTSASNAATDAATAKTQATNAATSASNAETSASAAQTSAKNAESSASAAQTQATNAASSASAAQTSASAAQTSAKNAESSASAAKTSASNAESSASAAATSASAAASDAATAKSQASAATTAANEAKTQAASAVTSATEAKTQAAAAKTAADQATTDAATAGIAASRAQTAAQAAEKAIGIEPDDTKTEDELASQAWFWTDDSGAHVVAGRKDGTPTSATQTDINDKGLSVVSLEDYSTLASFGVDSDGKAVSRLGETTGSYTEVTDSGMDIYAMQGDVAKTEIDFGKLNSSAACYRYKNPLSSSGQEITVGDYAVAFGYSLNMETPEESLPISHATAFKLSDLFPLGDKNLLDISLWFEKFPLSSYGQWSVGIVSKIEETKIGEYSFYTLVNDDDGSMNNLLHGETAPADEGLFFKRGISGVDSINDCYLVLAFRQTKSGGGIIAGRITSSYWISRSAYYFGNLTQNVVGRFGFDENGLTRAKIGSDGYVQIDDMEVDIYRGDATIVKESSIAFGGFYTGAKPVKEEGWAISFGNSSQLAATVPSGFSGNAYSVFKLVDLFDWTSSKIRKFALEMWATAWASDSSISYLEFYIIDKPYLYDDSGEMVDYLYYSGQELPLSVTTDEMQWAKIQNLYIAFNLATIPDSLPTKVLFYMSTSYRITYYLYTPTGEASLQSHFGRKTELSYTEGTDYRTPMFSLDPDAGFKIVSPDANGWDTPGASVTGDTDGLWLGSSGTISAYAPKINLETGPVLSTERISNRSNYSGSGGLVLDHLSENDDTGLWIARNGSLVQGFIQSSGGNRGVWDGTQNNWYFYRPSGSKDTYINGLASSFQYKSYSIYTGRSIAGGSYTQGTTSISNSGYKPFAIAGWHTSTRWHNCNRAYLSAINNGSGTITWMVNNWNSSAKSGDLTLYVLWIRY